MGKRKQNVVKEKPRTGKKVLLVNQSERENYCAFSGKKLPRKGMVVQDGENYFVGYQEAEAYANNQ